MAQILLLTSLQCRWLGTTISHTPNSGCVIRGNTSDQMTLLAVCWDLIPAPSLGSTWLGSVFLFLPEFFIYFEFKPLTGCSLQTLVHSTFLLLLWSSIKYGKFKFWQNPAWRLSLCCESSWYQIVEALLSPARKICSFSLHVVYILFLHWSLSYIFS